MYYFCMHGSHVCTLSEPPEGRAHRRRLLYTYITLVKVLDQGSEDITTQIHF